MKSMGRNFQEEAGQVKYLRLLLQFLQPEDKRPEWEKDVWNLENLGFEVRQNPIQMIKTIKFTGIRQETIRDEVKRASYIRIKYLSVGSLQGEIRAVRRFSEFLAERSPEITSLGEVGRLNIEEYLTHINLERGQERNTLLCPLRGKLPVAPSAVVAGRGDPETVARVSEPCTYL